MKIIKLNDDFTINYGVPINEFSSDGIKQAVYEVLKFNKNSDIYNEESGIDYFNFFHTEDTNKATLRLKENIIKELSMIPYVVNVKNVEIKKKEKQIIFNMDLIYLDKNINDVEDKNVDNVLKNIQFKFSV